MKLKIKYCLYVRPNKDGEYDEFVAKRLIAAGLAVEDKSKSEKKK